MVLEILKNGLRWTTELRVNCTSNLKPLGAKEFLGLSKWQREKFVVKFYFPTTTSWLYSLSRNEMELSLTHQLCWHVTCVVCGDRQPRSCVIKTVYYEYPLLTFQVWLNFSIRCSQKTQEEKKKRGRHRQDGLQYCLGWANVCNRTRQKNKQTKTHQLLLNDSINCSINVSNYYSLSRTWIVDYGLLQDIENREKRK